MIKRNFVAIAMALLSALISVIYAEHRQNLAENWQFGQARLSKRYPAEVPGVVHTDLMRNGIIEDPYFGLNERRVQWVDKEDWIYETVIVPGADLMKEQNKELVFEGLDTYADVYLNDEKILEADNMFREWTVDVTPRLHDGENTLKIYFHSPIKVDMPKWEKRPGQYRASNDQSENGGVFDRKLSVFARKAGYHYGWDWGPRLVTSGIWRDAYLRGWSGTRINNVHIRQKDVTEKRAYLSSIVEIEADKDFDNILVTVADKDNPSLKASKKCNLKKGLNTVSLDFDVKNPRLWWCNGLGKTELYTFITTLSDGKNNLSTKEERIGLRSVEVVTDPDSDGHMQFYFKLNGVPVFAKGTNYIPQDNFLPSVTDERYLSTLQDAVDANMNMIRIWGGGIYENDIFYDLCDELGLMVWQDFMFACSMYPATGEWLDNVKMEAQDNLRRLRNHPSIVIWCGGNECLDAWYNWGWRNRHMEENPGEAQRIEEEMNRQYFEALPEMMALHNPDSFYWPSSPFSGKGKGSDGLNGDRHYYGVWQRKHPISQYNKEKSHFFSEYGVQSFPEYATVLKFAPDTTTHTLNSDVMMWHQRGGENANNLIAWYLENEYHIPTDFRNMIYMNQLFQGDAMRTAIESHRRNMPYCMGSMPWQHDDCWPVASWSTRDYYGNWKAAHYMVRDAFKDLIVSSEIDNDSIKVYLVSDLLRERNGNLKVTVYNLNGTKVWHKEIPVTVPANTSSIVWSSPVAAIIGSEQPNNLVINLKIEADHQSDEGNFYLCRQSDLKLKDTNIECTVSQISDGYELSFLTDKFVRALAISIEGENSHFDDNYFDLIPGEEKKCRVKSNISPDEFKVRLTLNTLNPTTSLSFK